MAPQVAVIIPCYREPYQRIRETVDSALATPGVDRVRVVVDGRPAGGYGSGQEHLDDLPCEVIGYWENLGCSAALNHGIRGLADDDIACRLDVGDVFYPESKARQIQVVRSGQARCSSSPHHDPVTGQDWRIPDRWESRIYTDSLFTGCTNVYRVSVWREVGGHDESLRYKADWEFSMRVQFHVGWHMHPEVTCSAGMFPDGFTARAVADPVKRALREHCNRVASERGRAWANPDANAHLFDEAWCRKRGLRPLARRR